MSCPHGIWHEEDCEICTMVEAYQSRIDGLEALLEEIRESLLDYHITDEAINKIEGELK